MENNEETKPQPTTAQSGSSKRLVVLLLFLLAVGAGCFYEFSIARPAFQEAWEKVREVDEGDSSSETTAEDIRVMLGRDPIVIDDSVREGCVVHSYRWPSGLLVKSHDIHVVFTKLKKSLEDSKPELKGKLYYYSASAGQPLDPETNFPTEKQTIVINLNPPMINLGGGAPQPRGDGEGKKGGKRGKRGERGGRDRSEEEKKSEGEEGAESHEYAEGESHEHAEDGDAKKESGEHEHAEDGDAKKESESGEAVEKKEESTEEKSKEKSEEKGDG